MSILNKIISYFPSKSATTQGIDVNLLTLLQSDKHKERIVNLRASTAEVQKQLKDNLPCFTVAGTFSRRCEEGILIRSGLAAVDLDSAEDYDIPHLLNELKKLDCIAYVGLSCRGKRLYCIVPFLYPDKYEKHYQRLIQSFNDLGLPMGDECHKAISQPRFVSWNDNTTQIFNHAAKPYALLPAEKTFHHIKHSYPSGGAAGTPENAFQWCNEQINKSHAFVKDNRHAYVIALARYCNLKGLTEGETLNGCLNYVQPDFPEAEITDIVRHVYTTQADSHNKYPFAAKNPDHPPVFREPTREPQEQLIETPFIGTDGKFYIPMPIDPKRIAVYESPEAYNKRLHIPTYIDKDEAEKLFSTLLPINWQTLQTVSQ